MVDPRILTEAVEPPYIDGGASTRLLAEIWDHLWPWSRNGFQRQRFIQASGLGLAAATSVAWYLAAMGSMTPVAIIGWWFGWSVFEVVVRLGSKPYVKDGPWWGRRYRRASVMDMICYVGFKNLLIGATLFLLLKSLGLVQV